MKTSTRAALAHLCLSELTSEADVLVTDVLIIDKMGLLAKLYGLADIAFVGGSFRGSVHNVMEPAALGRPCYLWSDDPECARGVFACGSRWCEIGSDCARAGRCYHGVVSRCGGARDDSRRCWQAVD